MGAPELAGFCGGDGCFLIGTSGFRIWSAGDGLGLGVWWCGTGGCGVMKIGGHGP